MKISNANRVRAVNSISRVKAIIIVIVQVIVKGLVIAKIMVIVIAKGIVIVIVMVIG